IASTERTNSSVCAPGLSLAATNATGTRASSQSMGLVRSSLTKGFMFHLNLDLRTPAGGRDYYGERGITTSFQVRSGLNDVMRSASSVVRGPRSFWKILPV